MGLPRKETLEVTRKEMAMEIGKSSKVVGDAYQPEVTLHSLCKAWISPVGSPQVIPTSQTFFSFPAHLEKHHNPHPDLQCPA